MKKAVVVILQSSVSLALLAWIFHDEKFRAEAWSTFSSARLEWIFLGLLVAGIGCVAGVVRWGIFLKVMGIHISAWDTTRLTFIGLFFNNFLVGAVGGDVVKVVWLSARGHKKSSALLSVLMDRMSGFGALLLFSLVFMAGRLDWLLQSPVVAGIISVTFAYLLGSLILLTVSFLLCRKGAGYIPRWMPGREKLGEVAIAYYQFVVAWRATLFASVLSGVILLAYFLTFYGVALALDVRIPLLDFLALMPTVDVIAALPVSLGGFGVREQVFITLLGQLCAVSEARAVSISLGGAFLSIVWSLLGAAMLPSYRRSVGGEASA